MSVNHQEWSMKNKFYHSNANRKWSSVKKLCNEILIVSTNKLIVDTWKLNLYLD